MQLSQKKMRNFFSPLFFLISLLPNFFIPNVNSLHGQYLEDQKIKGNYFNFESSMSTKLVFGRCLDDQRSLLIQFKNGLTFDPTNSSKLVTWNQSDEDCCTWTGVTCTSSGHVISLELENESISSGIENSTSTLSSFRHLEKLNLAFNRFKDVQIPKGIYNLANLTYLNLSNAGFVGQIPVEVSQMTRLVTLDLSTESPRFEPLKLENPNLKTLVQNLNDLQQLYLDNVNISATGRDWCVALSNLRTLSLTNCQLSGPIDSSFSQLHPLSVLRLDDNNLSTTIPSFFANFSNLSSLSLSNCYLQGFFPEKIFQLRTLENLDVSGNTLLDGILPDFPRGGSLRRIILSDTNFSGSLSDSIGNLGMLSILDMSNCNIGGQLPTTITSLTKLKYFFLSFNNLTGLVPQLNMSKKLSYIDLSNNGLSGSLSSTHFEGFANLVYVNLAYNSLNGRIPPVLFELPSLKELDLSNNQFGGQLREQSSSRTSSSQLDTLDLSSNLLNGSIPGFLFELPQLKYLDLSFNLFNGTKLEHTSSLLPQLTILSIASCNLQHFPDLRNQSMMSFLDLSDNQIKGEIPNWIWEIGNESLTHLNLSHNLLQHLQKPYRISTLNILDIHSNKIEGDLPIPPPSAFYIDYSGNNFNRPIPKSICKASYLQVLDLSDNSLSGKIPNCLLSNENLGVLNLGRNNLSSAIPDTFSPNCELITLDLRRNNLTGQIPRSLANCTSLEVFNVGNNNIEDTVPCMLKNSSSLRVIILRSNKFHGDFWCDNNWPSLRIIDIAFNKFNGNLSPRLFLGWRGMMLNNDAELDYLGFIFLDSFNYQVSVTVTIKGSELELVKIPTIFISIDFSNNNFHGEIPETVGNLSSLYILNMSHNALTGKIPKSIGKLPQLGSLDLSKNKLSGVIPEEIGGLTFISFLNLSYNRLFGRIPSGRQLQTFSSASYEGNVGLCGFPLDKKCDDVSPPSSEEKQPENSKTSEIVWGYVSAAIGFSVGFGMTVSYFCWFCDSALFMRSFYFIVYIFDSCIHRRHGSV